MLFVFLGWLLSPMGNAQMVGVERKRYEVACVRRKRPLNNLKYFSATYALEKIWKNAYWSVMGYDIWMMGVY